MALQNDFVMRIIEKMYHTFKAILAQDDDARDRIARIEATIGEVLHTRSDRVTLLAPQALRELDDRLALHVGLLFSLHARLHPGAETKNRSLAMALEGLRRGHLVASEEVNEDVIETIGGLLEDESMTPHLDAASASALHALLFHVYRTREDIPRAEDHLFIALEIQTDQELLSNGLAWYQALLGREDDALVERGSSRQEIEQAIQDLMEL